MMYQIILIVNQQFWTKLVFQLSVWYKNKVGSQDLSYQLWCLFCNTCMCKVFENIFNMSLMIMWWNIVVQVIPHNWYMSFGKFGGLPTVVACRENYTCIPRQGQIKIWVWVPTSSLKHPTPLDVKFNWAQCVKCNFKRMEPIPIGEQWTSEISSILEVWSTFIGSHLTKALATSTVLT